MCAKQIILRQVCGLNRETLEAGTTHKKHLESMSVMQHGKGKEGMKPRILCRDLNHWSGLLINCQDQSSLRGYRGSCMTPSVIGALSGN